MKGLSFNLHYRLLISLISPVEHFEVYKSFKGKTIFCFSIMEDQDSDFLDISKYYRHLGLTRAIWYCYFVIKRVPELSSVIDSSRLTVILLGRSKPEEVV